MYCLSSSLTVCQSRKQFLGHLLDRAFAAAPAHEEGEPLGVERVVGQPVQPFASSRRHTAHTWTRRTEKVEIDPLVATGEVADPSRSLS